MARKTTTRSTRERLSRWIEQADDLLAEIDKAQANNESRRQAR